MPIKVTCQCGQSFAAKDELAGKTVKCPKCTKPLRIPENGPRVGAPASQQSAAVAAAPQRASAGASGGQTGLGGPLPSAGGAGSILDEAGIAAAPVGTRPCPGCAAPLPPSAVLCVKCGYNLKLGRRMDTVRMTADPLEGGHEATASQLLERAARMIEEEKEEERKKTKEGTPWWAYLIGLGCIVAFIITMRMLPPRVALMTGGFLLYGAAVLVNLYAWIRVIIIAFAENVGHGIGCLICGLYAFGYMFMRWDQCGGYLLMILATNAMANLVWFAIAIGLEDVEEDSMVPPPDPPPAAVAGSDLDWQPPALIKA